MGNTKKAIQDLKQIISANRSYYRAYQSLGRIYYAMKLYPEAIHYYEQSLQWSNTDETVWNTLAAAYNATKQFGQAFKCYDISLKLNAANAKTYIHMAGLYQNSFQWEKARHAYEKAQELDDSLTELSIPLFICKNRLCDWEGYDDSLQFLKDQLSANQQNNHFLINSFDVLALPLSPKEQYFVARKEVELSFKHFKQTQAYKQKHRPQKHDKLRIGYISSSFRDYPTGHLTQDMYALHNRNQFEVFAYSYGKDDGSVWRKKIEKGCDHFIDIATWSIEQAAQRIHDDKIDVLVDLMGFTAGARLEINALRPAPINVRYLGAPFTSGASFFDYFISDPFITPPGEEAYFTEKLALLPHCYQVNPLSQQVAEDIPTRKECGLPDSGIVFCAFNNSYKIEPRIFKAWMEILNAVPGSVLWLQASGMTQKNLMNQAKQFDISQERLIFANTMPKDRHLARHAHADIYLDTHYYNAHTTASDALWMKVPVITCPGKTFQSRVAGSLLNSIGLQELIMPDLDSYVSKAISLALDPCALQKLKQTLESNLKHSPLFDCRRFVKNLEKAYITMWENYRQNKKSSFIVKEQDYS